MNNNPLMQFARRPDLTVRLATTPSWYSDGFINYTQLKMKDEDGSLITAIFDIFKYD